MKAGHGKTTILNELEKRGMKKAVNYTTRPRRESEKEKAEYEFITKPQFEEMWEQGKLLQRAEFNGEYYGISTDSLKENVVCISIVDSVKDIQQKAIELGKQDIPLTVFYIYVPEQERVTRMLKRGDSIEGIQTRVSIDREKFKRAREVADYVIENQQLDKAVEEILEQVKARG